MFTAKCVVGIGEQRRRSSGSDESGQRLATGHHGEQNQSEITRHESQPNDPALDPEGPSIEDPPVTLGLRSRRTSQRLMFMLTPCEGANKMLAIASTSVEYRQEPRQ